MKNSKNKVQFEKVKGRGFKNIGKTFLMSCSLSILGNGALAQFGDPCVTDPDDYTSYVVAGDFTGASDYNRPDDVVMINSNQALGGVFTTVDMLISVSGTQQLLKSVSVTPSVEGYDLDHVGGRMVGGDFDNDGRRDDFITLFRVSPTSMRFDLFQSNGATSFVRSTFYTQTGYDADKITGRVVSGDFDSDGDWDDIAAFYDYGGGQTRIHVWLSNGTTMVYQSSTGWWSNLGYTASKVTNRVVSGDFDKDGKVDDIAAFYDYGAGQTRIHVWGGTGTSFAYQGAAGWYIATDYTASKISGRVVSVNITKDDENYDDIVAFYDVGGGVTKMHVFQSTGTSFDFLGSDAIWSVSGYDANLITNKVVALESISTSNTLGTSDILAFYDYGPTTNKYHIWTGGNFDFWGNLYVNYEQHKFCPWKKDAIADVESDNESGYNQPIQIKQYPNPTTDYFFYEMGDQIITEILITDMQGKVIVRRTVTMNNGKIDGLNLQPGNYLCVYLNENGIVDRQKMTIVN